MICQHTPAIPKPPQEKHHFTWWMLSRNIFQQYVGKPTKFYHGTWKCALWKRRMFSWKSSSSASRFNFLGLQWEKIRMNNGFPWVPTSEHLKWSPNSCCCLLFLAGGGESIMILGPQRNTSPSFQLSASKGGPLIPKRRMRAKAGVMLASQRWCGVPWWIL